jgi:HPt (histidine-containing phosphotransfer) domain-containing protein
VMDGYNAAMKIRSDLNLDTPVIAMTAHIMTGEREKCISYGMNDYISKPFKENELHAVITKYIGHSYLLTNTNHDHLTLQKTIMNENPNVVNLKDLYDLARGNNAFIKEMIEIFLEQNPLDLSEIEKAIPANDFESIKAASHKMKTSLGFMGMKHLLVTLSEMEILSENKEDMPKIAAMYQDIKSNCETAMEELSAVLLKLEKEA